MKGCADTCTLIESGDSVSWVKDYKPLKMEVPKFEKIGDKEKWVNQVKQMEGDANGYKRDVMSKQIRYNHHHKAPKTRIY
jgi:hypothetical protein